LGIPLREVAAGLGVSTAYVSDVELERRTATVKRLPQFVKVLKLSLSEKNAVYQAAGVLPAGVEKRLIEAPSLWDADFKALAVALEKLSSREDIRSALRGKISRRKTLSTS
jgi:transcriptional regulator with XRE-family HTH domain